MMSGGLPLSKTPHSYTHTLKEGFPNNTPNQPKETDKTHRVAMEEFGGSFGHHANSHAYFWF